VADAASPATLAGEGGKRRLPGVRVTSAASGVPAATATRRYATTLWCRSFVAAGQLPSLRASLEWEPPVPSYCSAFGLSFTCFFPFLKNWPHLDLPVLLAGRASGRPAWRRPPRRAACVCDLWFDLRGHGRLVVQLACATSGSTCVAAAASLCSFPERSGGRPAGPRLPRRVSHHAAPPACRCLAPGRVALAAARPSGHHDGVCLKSTAPSRRAAVV